MSRRPARFTEADVRRAIKAAGPDMFVEILPDGIIRIVPVRFLKLSEGVEPDDEEIIKLC